MPMNSFISVDDHVQENPEVWKARLSKRRWGDRIPHIERQGNGKECWVVGRRRLSLSEITRQAAIIHEGKVEVERWDDIPRAGVVPEERLKAMDTDGVAFSTLYPAVGGVTADWFTSIEDPDLELACIQAYNDWLIEEWASVNNRFIPQCIAPIYPVAATVAEIRRSVEKGHRGVIYPAIPMHLRKVPHINDAEYDPIWATCEDLGVPLCFHAGFCPGLQLTPLSELSPKLKSAFHAVTRSASAAFDVANVLFSRILLRHPGLKVVFAESTTGWAVFLLEYADHQFEQDQCQGYELTPSEMFKRQCFLTAWYDGVEMPARFIGADNIMWATNFPMTNSTWPDSRDYIERCFRKLTINDRKKILWDNAAKLYGLDKTPQNKPE